jgi:hypothetical protein
MNMLGVISIKKVMKIDIFLIIEVILVYNLVMLTIKFKNIYKIFTFTLTLVYYLSLALNAKDAFHQMKIL